MYTEGLLCTAHRRHSSKDLPKLPLQRTVFDIHPQHLRERAGRKLLSSGLKCTICKEMLLLPCTQNGGARKEAIKNNKRVKK